jgi:AraC-like DNA-binding protein
VFSTFSAELQRCVRGGFAEEIATSGTVRHARSIAREFRMKDDAFNRVLVRSGIDPVEHWRHTVLAFVPSDETWRMLLGGSSADARCLRSRTLTDVPEMERSPDVLVWDLSAAALMPQSRLLQHLDRIKPDRLVLWASPTEDCVPVWNLLSTVPSDLLWHGGHHEGPWLRHLLRANAELTARALLGAAVAAKVLLLPVPVQQGLLEILGGYPSGGKARQFTQRLMFGHRQAERDVRAATDQSLGRLVRMIRLASAWDLVASGEPIGNAARATGYRDSSAYAEGFRKLVGLSPSEAHRELDTAAFVGRLLASTRGPAVDIGLTLKA